MLYITLGGCQNYGPFLITLNIRYRDPKSDHNSDNHPYVVSSVWDVQLASSCCLALWAVELGVGGVTA